MRLSTAALCLVATLVLVSSASAQSRSRRPSTPQRPAPVARPAEAPQQADDERIIGSRLQAVQNEMKQQEQLLQRQLAEAQRIRESGLAKNDQALLNRAEALEKQAFARYEQQMQRLEQIKVPSHIGPAPTQGEPTPVDERGNQPIPQKAASPRPAEKESSPSADARVWWRPGTWLQGG